eukprot:6067942-Pleurochrysis_carterae.AAC.2
MRWTWCRCAGQRPGSSGLVSGIRPLGLAFLMQHLSVVQGLGPERPVNCARQRSLRFVYRNSARADEKTYSRQLEMQHINAN